MKMKIRTLIIFQQSQMFRYQFFFIKTWQTCSPFQYESCVQIKKFHYFYFCQSYVIKSAPWTILWFRNLGIFSVENIKRLHVFMFQTWDNSQLLRRVLWISAELTIVSSLKHKNTQPLYIFNRIRVLHLDRLVEGLDYIALQQQNRTDKCLCVWMKKRLLFQ